MEEFVIGGMNGEQNEPARYFVRGSGVGTSRLWYAAVVPMLGVYIELYANSLKLGILVWALAAIMGPAACLLDLRFIRSKGVDTSSLSPFFVLCPPLYIFKRTKLTGDSSICGAVWCIMIVYALMFNGFTSAATMKKSEMTSAVKETKWSYIDGMKDISSDKTIEETLQEIGGELEWDGEKLTKKGYILVTCWSKDKTADEESGSDGGKKAEVSAEFKLDFDGFYVGKYHLEQLTIDGKSYTSKEAAEYLKEYFGENDDSEADEENAEDDKGEDEDEDEQTSEEDEAA